MYGEIRRKRAIGIDFDDTITKHPEVFKKIIQLFLEDGCEVYIVTARQENGWCEQLREFAPLVTNVIFTSAIAKQDVVEIDIWIDDFPLGITHDFTEAKWVPGEHAGGLLMMDDLDVELDLYFNARELKSTKMLCRKETAMCRNCEYYTFIDTKIHASGGGEWAWGVCKENKFCDEEEYLEYYQKVDTHYCADFKENK